MTLHFAYGSNMHRAAMAARCPHAEPLGVATLVGWRFFISTDGYASVLRVPGSVVEGVLWRLTPRDLAVLNAYESINSGLYRRARLAVQPAAGAPRRALVYLGRSRIEGVPKRGYMEPVIEAAREWELSETYIRSLQRFAPGALRGARALMAGELT